MPIYVYQVVMDDPAEQEAAQVFEVWQSMSDPPLTHHPTTGQPVRRLITAPNVAGTWSDQKTKANLSDANLGRHGFTKYVKTGDGTYEKTTGKGPDKIVKK